MPKVSVIIPVYNVEKYLRECLDSVVNQTLTDIEIICVDDGSTDNSLQILKEYANKDDRIKIIQQQNQGAGLSRNNGLKSATSDYTIFLDSDDYFELNMLEKLYNNALNENADITICRSREYFDRENVFLDLKNAVHEKYLPNKNVFNYKDMPKHIIGFCQGWAWDKLYKTSFLKKYNLEFPDIHNSEDAAFVFLSLVLADRISVIKDNLVIHRKISTSLENKRDEYPFDYIKSAFILKEKLEQNNKYEDVKQSYINWLVVHSFWQLDTLKDKTNKKLLADKLQNEVFPVLNIYEYDKDYFYSEKDYRRLHSKNLLRNKKWYQNIFSLKNEGVYKVITILGINIRIKNKKYFQKKQIIKLNNEEIVLGNGSFYNKQNHQIINNINVVFATDDNYVEHCAVTIVSILANSPLSNYYNFYILNTGLTEENKRKLNSLKQKRDFGLNFIDVSNFDFSKFPLNRDWISATTYYRLYLPDVLPQDMDKCIYMDCDMLAEDDLAKLWSYNLDDYIAGVVEDESSKENVERLNLPPENKYFNAGMIVFNMKRLRNLNLAETSIAYYNEHEKQIIMQDQDILNGVLNGKCLYLPLRWNVASPAYTGYVLDHFYTKEEEKIAALNPAIVHFTGATKPWNLSALHPLNSEYKKYLIMTGFEEDIKRYKKQELLSKVFCKKTNTKEEKIYLFGIRIYHHQYGNYRFMENLFSIKNDKDKMHKIITILGVKIKIKRKNNAKG